MGVYADASYFLVYRQVATGFVESTGVVSAGIEVRRLESRGRPRESALALRDPVPLVVRPLFNPAEGYASYVVPAVLVLILQQTLLIGIGLLGGTAAESLRAGEGGPAPLAAPSPLARVLGRAAFYLALYAVYCVFVFGVVYRVFDFPERSRGADLVAVRAALPARLHLPGARPRRACSAAARRRCRCCSSARCPRSSWPASPGRRRRCRAGCALSRCCCRARAASPGFLRLTEMGAGLRHVRFELLVLCALAASYCAAAWLAERRAGRRRSA